jgi:hypothetical protein
MAEGINSQQGQTYPLHSTLPLPGSKVRADSPIVKGAPRRSPGVYGADDGIPIQ